MPIDTSLYFLNDTYDAKIIDKNIKLLKNKLYSRALESQKLIVNTETMYGTMSNFTINEELNRQYNLAHGSYTYIINKDIVPCYNKKKFVDKYQNNAFTLVDIINDPDIFSRKIIFNIDKYIFLLLKIIPINNQTILSITPDVVNGISQSRINTFISSNVSWSLTIEEQSDFYYTYRIKTSLFTPDTTNIKLSNIDYKIEYNKPSTLNHYMVAISSSTTDLNLLSFTKATIGLDIDNSECFITSSNYKNYIFINSNNCKCYIFNNSKKIGHGIINTIGTAIYIQIPYETNPIAVENIHVWEYDDINDIMTSKKNITISQLYPNIYNLSPLQINSKYYIDWYSVDNSHTSFDDNIKEYITANSPTYMTSIINETAPLDLLNYVPLNNYEYDYNDYVIKNIDGDLRQYKLAKLLELLKDNPIRYFEFMKEINNKNKKYITKSYNLSNDTYILSRNVTDNYNQIIDPDKRVSFTEAQTYITISNSISLDRDVILFINGLRVLPTLIVTEISNTYIYIPKSILDSNSVITIEAPLNPIYDINKKSSDFSIYKNNSYISFPDGSFDKVSEKYLLYYDRETLQYLPDNTFNYGITVKTKSLKNDSSEIKLQYFTAEEYSYLLTSLEEFFITSKNEKIRLLEDITFIDNINSFNKKISIRDLSIGTSDINMLNRQMSVTNTDNYRYITIPDLSVSTIGIFNDFKDDPDPNRFRVYVNGYLIDESEYSYTAPVYYGDNATFNILSYQPIIGVNSAIIEYLPYKETTIINSTVESIIPSILYFDNLLDITQLTSKPFDKYNCKVYVDKKRVSLNDIIETKYPNIIKINGFDINKKLRIDVLDSDNECYEYSLVKPSMLMNNLFAIDENFRTYINNNY